MEDVAIPRFEAKVLVLQIRQAADEQPRGAEQRQGNRGLHHHEDLLHPEAASFRGTVGAAQSINRIGARRHPCGCGAEEHTRDQRDAKCKREDGQRRRRVNWQVALPGHKAQQQPRSSVGNRESGKTSQHCQHDAFRQRLTYQPPARSSQG